MLTCTYDAEAGLIRSHADGFNNEAEMQAYVDALALAAARARQASGIVLHLVDGRDTVVQASATHSPLMAAGAKGSLRVDRIAVVLSSALVRMQTGNLPTNNGTLRMFADMGEAEAWLVAEGAALRAA